MEERIMKRLVDCMINATMNFLSQEARIFRYALSYCLILALFPTVIVIFTLFYTGVFDVGKVVGIGQIISISKSFKLDQFIVPLLETLQDKPLTNITSSIVTILISCFMASNSLYSFMLITAQQEKFRTYGILIRIKAIFVFIGLMLSILGIVIIAYISPVRIRTVGLIAVFVFLYLFFRSLSFAKRPIWYGLAGTLFSGITIGIFSFLFVKVLEFINYGSIYGTLAGVMGALLAINIISSIIYYGYCLNSAYDKDIEIKRYKTMWFYAYGEMALGYLETKIIVKTNRKLVRSFEKNNTNN